MRARYRRRVVMVLAMGVTFVMLAPEARARSGALGRGDISALRAKLRKPQARARLAVLSKLLLRQRTQPVVLKALAPAVRRLAAKDKRCEVRVEATRVLIWRRSELGKTPRKLILKAQTDPCPLANTSFVDWARHLGKGSRGTVVKGLSQLADKSPNYYVRCRALLKLGELRVKHAETLMARALAVGAKTELNGGGVRYTLDLHPTLPQCAVGALRKLHGMAKSPIGAVDRARVALLMKQLKNRKTPLAQRRQLLRRLLKARMRLLRGRPGEPTAHQVWSWRNKLSKRKLVSKSPPRICLHSKACGAGQACVFMVCVKNARALRALRVYDRARRVRRRRPGRWRNAEDRLAVNLGLGLGTVKWLRERKAQAPRLRVPPRRAPPRQLP